MSRRFGTLLRRYRKVDNGLTQAQLVLNLQALLGIKKYSKADISKWENGRAEPCIDVIEALEEILEVPNHRLVEASRELYSIDTTNVAIDAKQLYEDMVNLAKDLTAIISGSMVEIIIMPESIRAMVVPKNHVPEPAVSLVDHFDNEFRSRKDRLALYNRLISLQTSSRFENAFAQWKRELRHYDELVKYSVSPERADQAYNKLKRSADKAIAELWEAIEACRWCDG